MGSIKEGELRSSLRRGRLRLQAGRPFERLVASIQAELDPGASVTHDEQLTDRHGQRRQFDVVIRGKLGGHEILGVVECKDIRGKVGTPAVEAFVTKTESLRANLKIMVSRFGFTKPAHQLASHHGIRTLSLLKANRKTKGVAVGTYIHARRMRWGTIRSGATLADGTRLPIEDSLETARVNSMPIWGWILKEAYSTHNHVTAPSWYAVRLAFRKPVELVLPSRTVSIVGLELHLRRDVEYFRAPAFASGRALIEFNPDVLHVPKGASLETNFTVDPQLTGWERVDAIPEKPSELFPITLNLAWTPQTLPEVEFDPVDIAEVTFAPVPPNPRVQLAKSKRRRRARGGLRS